jgi:transposase
MSTQKPLPALNSVLNKTYGVKGWNVVRCPQDYPGGGVIYEIVPKDELIKCSICGAPHDSVTVIKKGEHVRDIRTTNTSSHKAYLKVHIPRLLCRHCNKTRQIDISSISRNYVSYTKQLELDIVTSFKYSSISGLSEKLNISWDIAYGAIYNFLSKKNVTKRFRNLEYISIDEKSYRKGHEYVTVVINSLNHEVLYVGETKGAQALDDFWVLLGKRRAKKIKAVAIDMSPAYISAVEQHLPLAKIVFDHFHVVKVLNDYLKILMASILMLAPKEVTKGNKFLLLKGRNNLNEKKGEAEKLSALLYLNQDLCKGYLLKEDIRRIWECDSKNKAAVTLLDWIDKTRYSLNFRLVNMGKFLEKHAEGILNWFDHPITSSGIEAMNTKIKSVLVRAYGYRNKPFMKLVILHINHIGVGYKCP